MTIVLTGTHTANSIAGHVIVPNVTVPTPYGVGVVPDPTQLLLSNYNGVAYGSKLAVFDLNDGNHVTTIKLMLYGCCHLFSYQDYGCLSTLLFPFVSLLGCCR